MTNEYINVRGQDGETYEVLPTDALLNFLQRMAEDETDEQGAEQCSYDLITPEVSYH